MIVQAFGFKGEFADDFVFLSLRPIPGDPRMMGKEETMLIRFVAGVSLENMASFEQSWGEVLNYLFGKGFGISALVDSQSPFWIKVAFVLDPAMGVPYETRFTTVWEGEYLQLATIR